MTREEKEHIGKYVLEIARLLEDGCYQQEIFLGAAHIIDEALEQESTTKKDFGVEDCVSRAEVLKLMKDNWHTHNGDWAMQESMDDIRALPSVTPQEPKTGHWIGTRRVGCGFGEYKEYIVPIKDGIVTDSCHCSECGEWLTGSDEYECYGNYCPNCGAKMVESQESEN